MKNISNSVQKKNRRLDAETSWSKKVTERQFLLSPCVQGWLWKLGLILGCAFFAYHGRALAIKSGQDPVLTSGTTLTVRMPASLNFPHVSQEDDVDDILESYQVYLKFVLIAGKRVSPKTASLLAKKYNSLKRRDPRRAALFLKGLRFEMEHFRQLKGASRRQFNTGSRTVNRWVRRYIRLWYREVDEHLFRTYAYQLARRADS